MTVPRVQFKIISLCGSSRRENIIRQFRDTGFDWSFFDALTALPPPLSYDPEETRRIRGRYLTQGELGCFASHYVLWQELCADHDAEAYIVLEDDVIINAPFFEKFLQTADDLAAPINYLRFYSKVPTTPLGRRPYMDRFIVEYGEVTYGTQAYFINKTAAQAYLDSIKNVRRPVDDEMDRAWVHNVPIYCVYPHPVMELTTPSTIQNARHQLNPPKGIGRLGWLYERSIERLRKQAYRTRRRMATR